MPIYEYICPSCNHEFELRQSFNDKCEVTCPRCQNSSKRIFSPVPIIFKGSGFYVTDHSSKSEIQDSPKSIDKSESKTESKVESKAEIKTTSKTEDKNESNTIKAGSKSEQ
jgi:putative FmdB family regulatory protein